MGESYTHYAPLIPFPTLEIHAVCEAYANDGWNVHGVTHVTMAKTQTSAIAVPGTPQQMALVPLSGVIASKVGTKDDVPTLPKVVREAQSVNG